jgi:hypothetical protein
MLRGSIEIVIIGRDAGILELAGRLIGQLAQRDTNLHAELLHVPDNIENRFKLGFSFPDSFPSGSHAKASGPRGLGLPSLGENVLAFHQPFGFYSGAISGALGAVTAVLTTAPGLDA